MKKIFLTSLIASTLFISGSLAASAQYYDQYQYTNQYSSYQNQNYVYSNYTNNYNQPLTNCYYTGTNPRTYYGDCRGVVYEQNYYPNYNHHSNYYPARNYQPYYYQQNTLGQYNTYGYNNGSWYPGYSTNNFSNLINGIAQTIIAPNTNCYIQNGYQICY